MDGGTAPHPSLVIFSLAISAPSPTDAAPDVCSLAIAVLDVPDRSVAAIGYTHLTLGVPNESATAKTGKLMVKLPIETPFTSASVKPWEGWAVHR